MIQRGWSTRILVRYALLQLPALTLLALILILVNRWVDIPTWLVWGILALWAAKDAILFPFVWRAYDWNRSKVADPMVGERGITKDRLAPSGYVKVRGELWKAEIMEGDPPIEKGEGIKVGGIRGLTLLVKPDNKENK